MNYMRPGVFLSCERNANSRYAPRRAGFFVPVACVFVLVKKDEARGPGRKPLRELTGESSFWLVPSKSEARFD
jgi:hypothetical protein